MTTILMPLYEDWASCSELLVRIDQVLVDAGRKGQVLIVDDGSTNEDPGASPQPGYRAIERVEVLVLRRNLGHQRAIAVGLAYIDQHPPDGAVVVMDCDGEDSPADIPRLLDAFEQKGGKEVVFAERTRRSEGFVFAVFYAFYRFVHLLLTGQSVRVGSFSVLSTKAIRSLVVVPELWNHYAAAVFVSRIPYTTIPTSRARRIAGDSKMGFVRLVMHGLSAISVFSDLISVRILLAAGVSVTLALGAILLGFIGSRLGIVDLPAWAVSLSAVLFLAVVQGITFVLLFTFTVLSNRKGAVVLPARDYVYFIDQLKVRFS